MPIWGPDPTLIDTRHRRRHSQGAKRLKTVSMAIAGAAHPRTAIDFGRGVDESSIELSNDQNEEAGTQEFTEKEGGAPADHRHWNAD